ncbi:MAG: hypothetical protein H6661_05840 [Ardenticatenaceae bacterium]|nr:hypothetical protein [Ardenticatenaceae bacterium]
MKMSILDRLKQLLSKKQPDTAHLDTLSETHLTRHRGFGTTGGCAAEVMQGFQPICGRRKPEWDLRTTEVLRK